MPVLTRLKNIVIRMFFDDHAPPHIHADDNEKSGLFELENFEMFKGNLDTKDQKEVKNWATKFKDKIKEMWFTQKITKLE